SIASDFEEDDTRATSGHRHPSGGGTKAKADVMPSSVPELAGFEGIRQMSTRPKRSPAVQDTKRSTKAQHSQLSKSKSHESSPTLATRSAPANQRKRKGAPAATDADGSHLAPMAAKSEESIATSI